MSQFICIIQTKTWISESFFLRKNFYMYLIKCLIDILISECAEYNYTGLISHFPLDLFFFLFSQSWKF